MSPVAGTATPFEGPPVEGFGGIGALTLAGFLDDAVMAKATVEVERPSEAADDTQRRNA